MEQLVPLEQMNRSFDITFWKKLGAQKRFAATWQMTLELLAMRGMRGRQSRLQRSTEALQPLPR